jgi:4a-hydroxytetrahydrobiopterin dehydratase
MSLADQHCVACTAGTPPLTDAEIKPLIEQTPGWALDEGHLTKAFTFPNFVEAVDFVNRITPVAEAEGHHPDLHVAWGKVRVELWTHKINGLTESDFVMAAKIDQVHDRLPQPAI